MGDTEEPNWCQGPGGSAYGVQRARREAGGRGLARRAAEGNRGTREGRGVCVCDLGWGRSKVARVPPTPWLPSLAAETRLCSLPSSPDRRASAWNGTATAYAPHAAPPRSLFLSPSLSLSLFLSFSLSLCLCVSFSVSTSLCMVSRDQCQGQCHGYHGATVCWVAGFRPSPGHPSHHVRRVGQWAPSSRWPGQLFVACLLSGGKDRLTRLTITVAIGGTRFATFFTAIRIK